jgi:hypothetical protein
MAGNTATIDVHTLRVQWASHSSMAAIASYWTITKDQLVRLRDVHDLPRRHDRRLRFKPDRREFRDPSPQEIAQRCKEVQATWDDATEFARRVQKGLRPFQLRVIPLEPDQYGTLRETTDEEPC